MYVCNNIFIIYKIFCQAEMIKKKTPKAISCATIKNINKCPQTTRSNILQASIEVFVRRGFVNATLEEIATEANVTRGAVYWHFKNKYDIFAALHEQLHQPLTSSILEDIKKQQDDSLKQLQELCVKLLVNLDQDEMRKKIIKVFLCKCDYSCGMEDILEKQKQQKLKNIDLFTKYFDRAKRDKRLSNKVNSKTIAISLACYMSGIVSEYLRNPQLFSLKKQAPLLMAQFFASFKTK